MADGCLLYYITDRTAFAADEPTRRRCILEKIEEAARAGVNYIQLREKDLITRELESLAREVVSILTQIRTEDPGLKTALLINSRADVALAVGTDGVHLRSHDILPQQVSSIWRKSLVGTAAAQSVAAVDTAPKLAPRTPTIGVSCHSAGEVFRAKADGATFALFAPVFEKKDSPRAEPAGLTKLREACKVDIPVLALGGITIQNAQSCLEAGAAGIAAIRLFQENEVASVVESLHRLSR